MKENGIMSNEKILKIIIYATLFIVYIFPTGFVKNLLPSLPVDKSIFLFTISLIYLVNVISNKKIKWKDFLFLFSIFLLLVISKNANCISLITILLLSDVIANKEKILKILKNTNMIYLCLIATIIYSLINFGKDGRYAFCAILEINQSGLAIFCLAMLLINKNKKIGYTTLIFGLLTVSRSYYLAVILYLMSKTKVIKIIMNKMQPSIKYFNYFNITVLSSLILLGVGYLYLQKYTMGEIFWGDEISNRLINIFDYSNLYRFITNLALIIIFIKNPIKLLVGITKEEYINYGRSIYSELSIPYKYTNPHNLFFSHLKAYGVFTIMEIIYISKILKKIVNKNNFMIYLAIIAYSIILGAGLYSYWLYLTVFILIVNENEEKRNEDSNN